ncbi:hypothetical protein ACLOJK_014417 [Asimina triloba]
MVKRLITVVSSFLEQQSVILAPCFTFGVGTPQNLNRKNQVHTHCEKRVAGSQNLELPISNVQLWGKRYRWAPFILSEIGIRNIPDESRYRLLKRKT